MRLDKYLKVSRLIKRRTVANEACDAGKVLVNGTDTRAAYHQSEGRNSYRIRYKRWRRRSVFCSSLSA